ncbi:hypothetical protein A4A49_15972 [Nicotiana attenuata]|uniref:Uncharacterized protein n=1 Tax=Nicotiana attenuata TaxID=49451 RepID=A0A1J6ILR3_NICAT|nr:hypothetical protein A4A49_15972 [Nicotiana attenuata]
MIDQLNSPDLDDLERNSDANLEQQQGSNQNRRQTNSIVDELENGQQGFKGCSALRLCSLGSQPKKMVQGRGSLG